MSKIAASKHLTHYTRALIIEGPAKAQLYAGGVPPEEADLFKVVELLWRHLQPVAPRPEFSVRLRNQLIEAARRQQNARKLGIMQTQDRSNSLLTSAAALGAAATLAGAYAYWRWTSSRQAA